MEMYSSDPHAARTVGMRRNNKMGSAETELRHEKEHVYSIKEHQGRPLERNESIKNMKGPRWCTTGLERRRHDERDITQLFIACSVTT